MAQDQNFLTIKQTSDLTGKSTKTIQRYIKNKRFTSAVKDKQYNKWLIPIYDLESVGWDLTKTKTTTQSNTSHTEKDKEIAVLYEKLKSKDKEIQRLEQIIESQKEHIKTVKFLEHIKTKKHWWNFR